MKINQFDRTNLRAINEDIQSALKSVAEKYGINFRYKGTSFSANNATFKIEGSVISETGIVETKERRDFKLFGYNYGLWPELLDSEINYAGEQYIVVGLNTRSPKFCVVGKRVSDGKTFKLTAEGVTRNQKKPTTV